MATNGKELLTYRLLLANDWPRLRQFFEGTRGFVPRPELGVASVAENGSGEIVGAVILQLVSYIGPLKIDPAYAGQVDFSKLKANIDRTFAAEKQSQLLIKGYVAITADERVARIAETSGMERKPEAILLVETFDGQHSIIG